MKLFSHNYNPNVDCYSISTWTPTEGRVVLPKEELVLCGMTCRGNASKDISRGECENTLTHFPVRGDRGWPLEVAGILPLCPSSPVVISWAKDGKGEDRDKPGSSLLRHLLQAQGVTASGAIQTAPDEPCSCTDQTAKGTGWPSTRTRTVASSWRQYSSLALSRFTNSTGEFYLVTNFLLFRFSGSFSIPECCLQLLCCTGSSGSQQKWVWAAKDASVAAPRNSLWTAAAKKRSIL